MGLVARTGRELEGAQTPKERPILFMPEMVVALLAGRKTQTRRLAKSPPVKCPYGAPGDWLWVRERLTFNGSLRYFADGAEVADCAGRRELLSRPYIRTMVPAIYMPSWAARVYLDITEVRAERVRSISEADAIAEGFASRDDFLNTFFGINKRAPADTDPWVWVITFRLAEGGATDGR